MKRLRRCRSQFINLKLDEKHNGTARVYLIISKFVKLTMICRC
jgi:hypothetical protein